MLKSTKSANKSVLEDAVNNVNTAVTITGTEAQPDEDDYGYVSQEADAYYKKMMAKYNAMPDDPKFSSGKKNTNTNLNSTKDRVRAALEKEKEDALLPHKRKRKHKDTEGIDEVEEEVKVEVKKPPRPKVAAPPPIDFNSLLKLAQTKQFEPIKIEPKKKEDDGPLMTKKQKKEYEKEQAWRERKLKGITAPPQPIESKKPDMRIPKLNSGPSSSKTVPSNSSKTIPDLKKPSLSSNTSKIPERPKFPIKSEKAQSSSSRPNPDRKPMLPPQKSLSKKPSAPSASSSSDRSLKQRIPDDKLRKALIAKKEMQGRELPKTMMMNGKPKQFPPPDVSRKPRDFPPSDVKKRPDMPGRPRQFPPPDGHRFPPQNVKRKPQMGHKRRILDDDDEEYDSEMDDFIDDGPDGTEDYSKYISEIFGYDKNKYKYADDEDDNMESSFAQQMREECISTKIGIMEDLEDMKQEKMDKMKKAKMKKSHRL